MEMHFPTRFPKVSLEPSLGTSESLLSETGRAEVPGRVHEFQAGRLAARRSRRMIRRSNVRNHPPWGIAFSAVLGVRDAGRCLRSELMIAHDARKPHCPQFSIDGGVVF